MSRIFISYRREDSAWQAGRIYDRLVARFGKESIFKDVDVIQAGDNFQQRIDEAVSQCDVLIAIIGQKWLSVTDEKERRRLDNPADWVRLEIETALNRENVRVIPILLDKVSMPATQDLPISLQPLCYRHAASIRQDPDFRKDVDYVLRIVEQHLKSTRGWDMEQAAQAWLNVLPIKEEDNEQDVEVLIEEGIARYKEGDNIGAIAKYDKAIKLDPSNVKAYFNRGLAKADSSGGWRHTTDYRSAITDYDKAIELRPNDAEAYLSRGTAKSALGYRQHAVADYNKAIELDPENAKAYNNRGTARYALGDEKCAVLDFERAIELLDGCENDNSYRMAVHNLRKITWPRRVAEGKIYEI